MSQSEADQKLDAIKSALFAGEKIRAIKLYREALGGGLAEAKTAVERLEAELRTTSPERFTAPPAKGGCTTILAVLVMVIFAAVIVSLVW